MIKMEMMMKTTKNNSILNEKEKQNQPMPGEVSPREAFIKARQFAVQERLKLKNK